MLAALSPQHHTWSDLGFYGHWRSCQSDQGCKKQVEQCLGSIAETLMKPSAARLLSSKDSCQTGCQGRTGGFNLLHRSLGPQCCAVSASYKAIIVVGRQQSPSCTDAVSMHVKCGCKVIHMDLVFLRLSTCRMLLLHRTAMLPASQGTQQVIMPHSELFY